MKELRTAFADAPAGLDDAAGDAGRIERIEQHFHPGPQRLNELVAGERFDQRELAS